MKNWLLPILGIVGLGGLYMYSQGEGGDSLPSGQMTEPQGGATATWEVREDGGEYFGYTQEDGESEEVVADLGTGVPIGYDVPVKAAIAAKNKLGGLGYMQIGAGDRSGYYAGRKAEREY